MNTDLIEKAKRRDLTGMHIAILARLSTESRYRKHQKERADDQDAHKPKSGADINGRDEQVRDCTAYLESLGAIVVHVYDEPHTSAWKRRRVRLEDGTVIYRVIRPVYRLALEDLRKGSVTENCKRLDGLMILDVDRLTRDNRDLEDAIDVVVHAHRPILDRRGSLDLLTESGRTNARVIVSFKNGQSADTAWRVANKHKALQREGIPAGGHRPFGWQEDKRTLHPVEAPLLKTAVDDILKGHKSVAAVVADWNRREITTARGKKWRQSNLKEILRNPRLCGYRMITVPTMPDDPEARSRHVVISYDADGAPVIGQWEKLIEPEERDKLLAIIGEAQVRGSGHNTRKHLLTGTLRCGKEGCDAVLRVTKASPSSNKPEGHFWYTCPARSQGGCGGMRIDGAKTDDAVTKIVIAKYEHEAAKREAVTVPQVWDREDELTRVLEDMAAAKAARNAGQITAERYYADLSAYDAQKRALDRDRNAFERRTRAAAELPVNLLEDWEAGKLTLTEQRAYIERALSAVIVKSAKGQRNVPVRERLIPIYVTSDNH